MFSRVVRSPYPLVSPPLTMLIRVRIWNASLARSTPAKAVTGPSEPPYSAFFRRRSFFLTVKTRVSAFVSTASAMVLGPYPAGADLHAQGVGRSRDGQLLSPGHVAGDPVAHHGRRHIRQLFDLRLVVGEVLCERVRMETEELEGDTLDVRRPYVPQGCTWFRGEAVHKGPRR